MSHFAKIEGGIVTQVIVAEQDVIDALDGEWVQTSYNTREGVHVLGGTPLRKNYAGIGYVYDAVRDAFYAPQPHPDCIFEETSATWRYPEPYPDGGAPHRWDSETKSWIILGGQP